MFKLFKDKSLKITSPVSGEMIRIENVKDEVFSQKMMGEGVAFIPQSGNIYAPVDGVLKVLFPTGHAFGIEMDNGVEIFVHIGIDTVEANGRGFEIQNIKQGDRVRQNDLIVKTDLEHLSKNYDMTAILVVSNHGDHKISFESCGRYSNHETIGNIKE